MNLKVKTTPRTVTITIAFDLSLKDDCWNLRDLIYWFRDRGMMHLSEPEKLLAEHGYPVEGEVK